MNETGDLVILVVDDNAAVRALIRGLVEEVTLAVIECDRGDHALGEYMRTRPDWVLMDIHMGEMDGLAATRAIRAWDPQARVFIITGHADAGHRSAAAAAGACGFLPKEDLLQLSQLLVQWSREGDAGSRAAERLSG